MFKPIPKLILIILLLKIVVNVPREYLPSDKYITTGVFQITSTAYIAVSVTQVYQVTFSGYVRSSSDFKVGFSLHTLNIKFNIQKLKFDLEVVSTSQIGFAIKFQSSQADLVSALKICYITKDPSYTQIFYVDTFRYSGPQFTVSKPPTVIDTFNFAISSSLPTGSVTNIIQRTFLNAFDVDSTILGTFNHIDIYPSSAFLNQTTVQISIETSRDDIVVHAFSITVVYYESLVALPASPPAQFTSEVKPSLLTRFSMDEIRQGNIVSGILSLTTTLKMYEYNTLVGIKNFHARTYLTPNFLNFKTIFTSDTNLRFQLANVYDQEYFIFQILIIHLKMCPLTQPIYVVYLDDCMLQCPNGYLVISDNNCVADLGLTLEYMVKKQDSNIIEMVFLLDNNDATYNALYGSIDWDKAISFDFQTLSRTIEYSASPKPRLKITLEYTEDLQSSDKTLSLTAYDQTIYPTNFKGFQQKSLPLKSITSINNLSIKHYPQSTYNMAKIISIASFTLSIVYMLFFLLGFIAGKVYILEMAFTAQVAFLSLISLNNVSPTMVGLGFLRYVFGYSYAAFDGSLSLDKVYGESENYMTLIGMPKYFVYNFNVMFVFSLIALILFFVFYFRRQKSEGHQQQNLQSISLQEQSQGLSYKFFSFDTMIYLVLWFGIWILFAGIKQVINLFRSTSSTSQNSLLTYIGLGFFVLNLILYFLYFTLYLKRLTHIKSFYRYFVSQNVYEEKSLSQPQTNLANSTKTKYFYLVYFVEKIVIVSLLSILYTFKYINLVVSSLSIVMIFLVIIFRPYKYTQKYSQNQQDSSSFRPNIRQIVNYSILLIIEVLFFITNQIQQNSFCLYIPVIVLALLLIQIILTVIFLIKDRIITEDFAYLKKIFSSIESTNHNKYKSTKNEATITVQTPRKPDSVEIKAQLLKQTATLRKSFHSNNHQKNNIQHPSYIQSTDRNNQVKIQPQFNVKINHNYEDYFKKINDIERNPHDEKGIDQVLEEMAQKKHRAQLNSEVNDQLITSKSKVQKLLIIKKN